MAGRAVVCGVCGSARLEFERRVAPGGALLDLVRCLSCGTSSTSPTGEMSDGPDGFGAAQQPAMDVRGRTGAGPEDALGADPTRGDYRQAGDDGVHVQTEATGDRVVAVVQTPQEGH